MHAQRNPRTPRLIAIRSGTREDLARLQRKKLAPAVQRLRDSHFIMIDLFVAGLSNIEIATKMGYSLARVSQLRSDPAVKLAVEERRGEAAAHRAERNDLAYDYMTAANLKAWRTINDHFDAADEAGELVPINRALAVAADSADRVGYTKRTTNINVNVDFAAKLEAARARSDAARVIDVKATKVA